MEKNPQVDGVCEEKPALHTSSAVTRALFLSGITKTVSPFLSVKVSRYNPVFSMEISLFCAESIAGISIAAANAIIFFLDGMTSFY